MRNWKKVLDVTAKTKKSVLSTFYLYKIQNTAATGRTINSIPAKARTGIE